MKKTTKILLVLAAVVAMTIGAVSTVMAADEFPTIATWGGDATKGYTAVDTNGEDIVRGWAVDADGYWYFFDSSKMLVSTFITWNEEIYYLDGAGHMAVGWIGFDADDTTATYETKINTVDKHEKKQFANIAQITGFNNVFEEAPVDAVGKPLFTNFLVADKTYEVAWCYFKTDGTMANHEWVQTPDELWYFMYGPYCVMGDYQVAIDLDKKELQYADANYLIQDNEGFFGFAPDGHAYFDWTEIIVTSGSLTTGDKYDNDTPYQDKDDDDDSRTSTSYWTYYHTNGRQVNTTKEDPKDPFSNKTAKDIYEGWENIDGNWCYFIEHDDYGMVLLQNDFVYDANTDEDGKLDDNANGREGTFYVDANGYLVKGNKTFTKDDTIGTWEEETDAAPATSGTIKFAASNATFKFGAESGEMLYGVQDKSYFLRPIGKTDFIYEVIQSGDSKNVQPTGKSIFNIATKFEKILKGTTVAPTANAAGKYIEGQRVDAMNFFLVINEAEYGSYDGDNTDETFIFYFESGVMQKNQAITFGEITIAIDANGYVITSTDATDNKVTVGGHTFVLDEGSTTNCLVLNNNSVEVTIPGVVK